MYDKPLQVTKETVAKELKNFEQINLPAMDYSTMGSVVPFDRVLDYGPTFSNYSANFIDDLKILKGNRFTGDEFSDF